MTKKQLLLAAQFLEQLADKLGGNRCNDWSWPDNWSGCERDAFARAYHQMNGDPEEFRPGMVLPDHCVVYLLSRALNQLAT